MHKSSITAGRSPFFRLGPPADARRTMAFGGRLQRRRQDMRCRRRRWGFERENLHWQRMAFTIQYGWFLCIFPETNAMIHGKCMANDMIHGFSSWNWLRYFKFSLADGMMLGNLFSMISKRSRGVLKGKASIDGKWSIASPTMDFVSHFFHQRPFFKIQKSTWKHHQTWCVKLVKGLWGLHLATEMVVQPMAVHPW